MTRRSAALASATSWIALSLASVALAQNQPVTAPSQDVPQSAPTTVIRTSTQLVIVDVTVQDATGHPVRGLTRNDFRIVESKSAQNLRNFEEHSSAPNAAAAPGPAMPPMPPGTFTDYTPVKPNAPLNILLLDSLNTPLKDQSYVRNQLQEYVKHADPAAQIAIFGLNSKLVILQGFTSDPHILKDAVEHKLIQRASNLLDDPSGSNTDTPKLSEIAADTVPATSSSDATASLADVVSQLQQFEAETASFQLQMRMQYTLDAFNQLAHYLYAFPGRKNLIWFSGSFPLNILPDPSVADPFAVMAGSEEEYREVTNLLTRAEVAVYPVDARGLMNNPAYDASRSGRNYVRSPAAFTNDLSKFNASQAAEHGTMDTMANDTGGHAFYNTNGLAQAVSQAIDSGSNYYTLTYSPTDHNWNGAFRNIHVELNGSAAGRDLKLSYRKGYYADDPSKPHNTDATATISAEEAASAKSSSGYVRAALARGAPAPSEILFKVRVLPATTALETTVATGNTTDPGGAMKGPYRRYGVDFAALAGDLTWTPSPNGRRSAVAAFEVLVYDADGKLLNSASKALRLNLTPEIYKVLIDQGLNTHLGVSAPAKGDFYLRIAIHDLASNRFGVVEVPTSTVSRLQPPNPPPTQSKPQPASAPTTVPPATALPPAPAATPSSSTTTIPPTQ